MTKLEQIKALVADMSKPEALAESFCELDDDAQAQFFVHVARLMATWPRNIYGADAAEWQANAIGRHLATCECSTEAARDFVRTVHLAMEAS